MQCEKLHNLHNTAYFTVTFFALKIDNILNDQISTLQKNGFLLVSDERVFFLFITWYVLFKKTKCAIICSVKNSTIFKEQFILYVQLAFLKAAKFWAPDFRRWQNSAPTRTSFFRISSFYQSICFLRKKQNMWKDAAWKVLQFRKNKLF